MVAPPPAPCGCPSSPWCWGRACRMTSPSGRTCSISPRRSWPRWRSTSRPTC